MRQADIVLGLALHQAALAQELVEARQHRLVALQRVAIVLDRLVGEDDVEQRRLADHRGLDAGILQELVEALHQGAAGLEHLLVGAGSLQDFERRQTGADAAVLFRSE